MFIIFHSVSVGIILTLFWATLFRYRCYNLSCQFSCTNIGKIIPISESFVMFSSPQGLFVISRSISILYSPKRFNISSVILSCRGDLQFWIFPKALCSSSIVIFSSHSSRLYLPWHCYYLLLSLPHNKARKYCFQLFITLASSAIVCPVTILIVFILFFLTQDLLVSCRKPFGFLYCRLLFSLQSPSSLSFTFVIIVLIFLILLGNVYIVFF